jgi:polyhydroxybutyrate depolymerase
MLTFSSIYQPVFGDQIIVDSIEVDDRFRKYILFVPENIGGTSPLVFALHGYGGSAQGMMEFSQMNSVAAQYGFVVCYPQGVFGPDHKNSWNAGYSNDEVDDVKFLTTLARHVQSEYQCSEKNTFCTGMSNGADMSYVLACKATEVFSAIAPVAGCMMETTFNQCRPGKTVPVFEMHGTKDDITLWDGDPNYSEKYGGYKSVRETINFWVKHNNCQVEETTSLPDVNLDDHSHIISEKYTNNEKNVQVVLYKIVNGHHDWPGSQGNMDIIAAEEIWKFFNQFIIE